jgi:5-hydroxyisourate hydrolase
MSSISTHVLDMVLGRPAAGVVLRLESHDHGAWVEYCESATDRDGRCRDLAPDAPPGTYRLVFRTGEYLARSGRRGIYPEIAIMFICDGGEHYHLPVLLSDNGYTTYRGS